MASPNTETAPIQRPQHVTTEMPLRRASSLSRQSRVTVSAHSAAFSTGPQIHHINSQTSPYSFAQADIYNLWKSNPKLANILNQPSVSELLEVHVLESGIPKPLLWWAVASRNSSIVSEILRDNSVDINDQDDIQGWSGLIKAVIEENVEICNILVRRRDINVNQREYQWGLTPLMIAAADGNAPIVELLIRSSSIDVNSKDVRWGRTALSWAAGQGQHETARVILTHSSTNIMSTDFEGRSPLSWSVEAGNLQLIQLLHGLVRDQILNHTDVDRRGQTPLWKAAFKGHTDAAMFLIRADQGQSFATDHYGRTPLIAAASQGHENIVRALLAPPLDRNASRSNLLWKDHNEQDALIHAARSGHDRVVHLILTSISPQERRTIIDGTDRHKRSALSWAASEGHLHVVRKLFQMGSRATAVLDDQEQAPLHNAVQRGHKDIVSILLRMDPLTADLIDATGRTPLSWAAGGGQTSILELLLDSEVDINSMDNKNWTVYRWAAEGKYRICQDILQRHQGFNIYDHDGHTFMTRMIAEGENKDDRNVCSYLAYGVFNDHPDTRTGRTPLAWAAFTGHEEFARYLLCSENVNPSSVDQQELTPMCHAINNGHQLIATLLYGCKSLHPWDKNVFWERAPGWAVRQRVLSKLFPALLPNLNVFGKIGGANLLTDDRSFRGLARTPPNHARLLIDSLSKP